MLETALVLAATAGTAGLTLHRARQREARAEAIYPAMGRLLPVEGRMIHVWQTGEGPDLVLIHGASANMREFAHGLAPRLARRFRVTLMDRPGMGWSDPPETDDPAEQARLLRGAASQLGLRDPLLLGHSYGGAIALAWALQGGTRGLVLLSGVSMPWEAGLGLWYRLTANPALRSLLVPLVSAYATRGQVDRSIAGIFAPQAAQPNYTGMSGIALTLRRRVLAINSRQINGLLRHIRAMIRLYPQLTLPIEVLHGDRDSIVPHHVHAEPVTTALPDARLTLLPGVGHMPHQTHPEAVEAAVLRLAARVGLGLD